MDSNSNSHSLKIQEANEELNSIQIQNLDIENKNEICVRVDTPNELLHLACTYGDIFLISYALALNADRNSTIERDMVIKDSLNNIKTKDMEKNNGYTPLIKAVKSGSISAVELLLLNGSKLSTCDFNGQTALHHATLNKNLKMVCLLLKRGADPLSLDKNNIDPIMIATDNCQPNIVTILRVAKMNNDLKESDMTYSGDPMFDEILKDLLTLTNEQTEEHNTNECDQTDSSDTSDQSK